MKNPEKKPLYLSIETSIIEKIKNNEYKPGEALPSLAEIAAMFGVGMITVRKAFDELYYKGYLIRKQGTQAIVTKDASQRSALHLDSSVGILYNTIDGSGLKYKEWPWSYSIIMGAQLKLMENCNLSTLIPILASSSGPVERILERDGDSFAGFIYLDTDNSENIYSLLQASGKPYVIINSALPSGNGQNNISLDYYQAAQDAAEYFISKKVKTFIYMMNPPSNPQIKETIRIKIKGFQETLLKNNVKPENILHKDTSLDIEDGEKVIESVLQKNIRLPVGIFAYADYPAMGACRACLKKGLKPQHDFMVVGATGLPESAGFEPPLSVIETPMKNMGGKAVEMLYRQIMEKTNSVTPEVFQLKFIVRRT